VGTPGLGVAGAKNDLKYSLDKCEEFNYVVEDLIASPIYPDLVGVGIGKERYYRKQLQLPLSKGEKNLITKE